MKKHTNIQQKTPEWLHIRKGKITGTSLKALMSSRKDTRDDVIYELIAQRLTVGVKEEYESAVDRGNRLEPEATAMFELHTGKKVETVGFAQRDDNDSISNSPDGHIIDEPAVLEVKCPEGKNYVKAWLTNEVPDEYEWQVVQYFVVDDNLERLYFWLYNPDIQIYPHHLIVVERADWQERIDLATQTEEEALEKVNGILETLITL